MKPTEITIQKISDTLGSNYYVIKAYFPSKLFGLIKPVWKYYYKQMLGIQEGGGYKIKWMKSIYYADSFDTIGIAKSEINLIKRDYNMYQISETEIYSEKVK